MANTALDPEVLQNFRDLQTSESPDFLKKYLLEFLKPIPIWIQNIEMAIQNKDFKKMEATSHALKSSCANTGIAGMSSLCQKLEKLGAKSSTDGALELFTQLQQEFEKVKIEIYSLPEFIQK